ncbi:hypothetical protein AKJ65_04310 [candidate division MSBL1 archaeon SCGC-AAA259E19]|uniref:Uroporphyrinogen decarboxylase (URO-D) domain-containing protein n=1 Tax=candidate division MSBL1 archaeon SCGC-AAA259E19 TaxID=1698264 RepID=A0A133UJR9_9EURY|nr:hypothetical protein AKJ65_04310 [candidate division MSBL1 archaeon SCGC-AAA259E19]
MTHRKRLLNVLKGDKPDRIPWIPRIKLWYEFHKQNGTLPPRYEGCSRREIERDLGMGTPAREGRVFEIQLDEDIEVSRKSNRGETLIRYETPIGSVNSKKSSALEQYGKETVEHLIKSEDDYRTVEYIIENLHFEPTYENYLEYRREVGEDGVPLTVVGLWPPGGTGEHCPMHRILRDFLGYERGYRHLLKKCPEKIRHLNRVLTDKAEEMHQIVLNSPAELILHGSHFDIQMTPPYIYEDYFLPYFRDFAEKVHKSDKKLGCHLDAETDGLYELIAESGFDFVECFATTPLVNNTTIEEARRKWKDKIVIWGGIPSIILEKSYSESKFKNYLLNLFKTIEPGDDFVLGISDNLMPGSKFDRVVLISSLVKACCEYPLDVENVKSFLSM